MAELGGSGTTCADTASASVQEHALNLARCKASSGRPQPLHSMANLAHPDQSRFKPYLRCVFPPPAAARRRPSKPPQLLT